jgi:hypothetical protein
MKSNKIDNRTSNEEAALIAPLERAFYRGNYYEARKVANRLLQSSDSTPFVLEKAKQILVRTGNDPYVLWIGLITVVCALLIALLALR